jgi:hypothetical protein
MKKLYNKYQTNGADVDTTIHCDCGTSFIVYNESCDYQCPNCKRLYRIELSVYSLDVEDKEDNFVLVGRVDTSYDR